MNSKEALERLLKYANINEAELITKYGYSGSNDIDIIKQDLDRLEKLEKENQELLVNKNVAQGIAKKFKEENNKLKKAIEILKDNHEITLHYDDEFPTPMISINGVYSYINEEEYELLKEGLGNEN